MPNAPGTTADKRWHVYSEDLRGGRYWCVAVPGAEETIDIHEDDNGEAVAKLIARAPELETENARLRAALTRLRDCDWTIGWGDRMEPVRDIARAALEGHDDRLHP